MLGKFVRAVPRATRALSVSTSVRPSITSHARIAAPASRNARREYHEKVLDHYSSPRNVGSMDKSLTSVGTVSLCSPSNDPCLHKELIVRKGLVGAPACGDVMKLQIKVDPETNTISDVKFKTFGCGSAIASSSYMTEVRTSVIWLHVKREGNRSRANDQGSW